MRTLLHVIDQYDREQREYIDHLEGEVTRLETEKGELVNQLVSYVATVDRMKLDLILSGALRRPSDAAELPEATQTALSARVAKLEEALRFYAAEDERNGWGGVARAALEEGHV